MGSRRLTHFLQNSPLHEVVAGESAIVLLAAAAWNPITGWGILLSTYVSSRDGELATQPHSYRLAILSKLDLAILSYYDHLPNSLDA